MSTETPSTTLTLSVIVPWLLTLMTFAGGVWQFTSAQREANRRPFLEKQLELCFQASEAAARLASEANPAKWEEARATFWRLYWGPLSIVEDRHVESAMVALGNLVPREKVASPALPMKELAGPSYELAHAVRDLVLTSWRIDLPPLARSRSSGP